MLREGEFCVLAYRGKRWVLGLEERRVMKRVIRTLNNLYQERFARTPRGVMANRISGNLLSVIKKGGELDIELSYQEASAEYIRRMSESGLTKKEPPFDLGVFFRSMVSIIVQKSQATGRDLDHAIYKAKELADG